MQLILLFTLTSIVATKFFSNDNIGIKYRLATGTDHPHLTKLVIQNHLALSDDCPEEWLSQLSDVPSDFPHLLSADAFARGVYYVAVTTRDGEIVGSAGVTPVVPEKKDDGGCCYGLTAITVKKEWRGGGIGTELANMALSGARKSGAKKVKLVTLKETMESAWRLYEKLGFRRVGEKVSAEYPRKMTVLYYEMKL